jgi:uncharacterized protein
MGLMLGAFGPNVPLETVPDETKLKMGGTMATEADLRETRDGQGARAQVGGGTTSEQTRAALSALYDAVVRGDLEAFLAGMHPEVEIHEPDWLPYGGVYRGTNEVKDVLIAATKVIDLSRLSVESMFVDGDQGFVVVRAYALATGAPTLVGEHWTMKDGKPGHCRVYHFDTAPVLDALDA